MERSWDGQLQQPTDRRQVILDRNKLVLMNEWMNGHMGRVGRLNIMTITALRRLYLPSIPPLFHLFHTPLLSPLL